MLTLCVIRCAVHRRSDRCVHPHSRGGGGLHVRGGGQWQAAVRLTLRACDHRYGFRETKELCCGRKRRKGDPRKRKKGCCRRKQRASDGPPKESKSVVAAPLPNRTCDTKCVTLTLPWCPPLQAKVRVPLPQVLLLPLPGAQASLILAAQGSSPEAQDARLRDDVVAT